MHRSAESPAVWFVEQRGFTGDHVSQSENAAHVYIYIGGGSPQCVLFARETHVRFIGIHMHVHIYMQMS